eukprot:6640018-Alexandrium_andersonii.AAC.1
MSASLVGSEMCIRDSSHRRWPRIFPPGLRRRSASNQRIAADPWQQCTRLGALRSSFLRALTPLSLGRSLR